MRISDWSSDVCSSDLTARAARGAEVHVRQAAIEQERQLAAHRMAFPQHRAAMPGADARQFALPRLVVRAPVALDARAPLRPVPLPAPAVHRFAGELHDRAQACAVLAGAQSAVVLGAAPSNPTSAASRAGIRGG